MEPICIDPPDPAAPTLISWRKNSAGAKATPTSAPSEDAGRWVWLRSQMAIGREPRQRVFAGTAKESGKNEERERRAFALGPAQRETVFQETGRYCFVVYSRVYVPPPKSPKCACPDCVDIECPEIHSLRRNLRKIVHAANVDILSRFDNRRRDWVTTVKKGTDEGRICWF